MGSRFSEYCQSLAKWYSVELHVSNLWNVDLTRVSLKWCSRSVGRGGQSHCFMQVVYMIKTVNVLEAQPLLHGINWETFALSFPLSPHPSSSLFPSFLLPLLSPFNIVSQSGTLVTVSAPTLTWPQHSGATISRPTSDSPWCYSLSGCGRTCWKCPPQSYAQKSHYLTALEAPFAPSPCIVVHTFHIGKGSHMLYFEIIITKVKVSQPQFSYLGARGETHYPCQPLPDRISPKDRATT